MKTIVTIKELREWIQNVKKSGETIGFVPTMGFLHAGHGRLIAKAREDNQRVVVSVFVNPLQFGPNEDLDRYPKDLASDQSLCTELGVDVLFAPSVEEMYGQDGAVTRIHVAVLGNHLCGASRPGHFDGVATVVAKLFHLVQPDRAYFGKKDYQQARILERMVRDLSFPVTIVPVDIVREPDGLAKSSRNAYLTEAQRTLAPILHTVLQNLKRMVEEEQVELITALELTRTKLAEHPQIRLDYLTCVDVEQLQPIQTLTRGMKAVCAIAAFFGKTRLIDNIELYKS